MAIASLSKSRSDREESRGSSCSSMGSPTLKLKSEGAWGLRGVRRERAEEEPKEEGVPGEEEGANVEGEGVSVRRRSFKGALLRRAVRGGVLGVEALDAPMLLLLLLLLPPPP